MKEQVLLKIFSYQNDLFRKSKFFIFFLLTNKIYFYTLFQWFKIKKNENNYSKN